MRYIEHLLEPDRLLLAWQAQDSSARSRYVVGELVRKSEAVKLHYFTNADDYKEASEHGFKGYPAFHSKNESTYDNQVLEAFTRRLPPRSRRDFSRFLELRGIKADAQISDFALLGYTGAKLPDDGFELIHPFDSVEKPFEFIIEVAGFRHVTEVTIESIPIGQAVRFVPEPTNKYDPKAILVKMNDKKLGYVDRGRLELFHRHLSNGDKIQGEIVRKNGTADRPLVYIYTSINCHGFD